MKKLKNNKGFTLVELLAVIVVLAIVMGIAAVAITNVLDSTRKNAYVATAKQFITGAKSLVNADEVEIMLGGTSKYTPKCVSGGEIKKIELSNITTEGSNSDSTKDTDKSPYGTKLDKAKSYVNVKSVYGTNGTCTYEYSIFITDGIYSIGTEEAPLLETDLGSDDVKAQSGYKAS